MLGEVAVLPSVSGIEPAEWDAIAHDEYVFQRHAYLQALERTRINDCEYRFFVARDRDGQLIAHAPLYSISTALDTFLPKSTRLAKAIAAVRRVRPNFLVVRCVECGVPTALGSAIAMRQDLSAADRRVVLTRLAEAMGRFADAMRADLIVLRDFEAGELAEVDPLVDQAFRRVRLLDAARLRLPWRSFDEYLAALRSRYRYSIRHDIARAAQFGIRRELATDFSPFADRMAALWRMTNARSNTYQREALRADYFANMGRWARDLFTCRLYWLGEELVAFGLSQVGRQRLATTYLGVDYDYNAKGALILNLYYDAIRDATAMGKELLDFGIGTYDLKAELGARGVPLYALVRHRRRRVTPVVAGLVSAMTPRHASPVRHLFNGQPAPGGSRELR
jgi:hypothetical protein